MRVKDKVDGFLQWAKRNQRLFLLSDYLEQERRRDWLSRPPQAPYQQTVFPVRPAPESINSVLIYKPDDIGDAIYSLPAIVQLKKHFSQAKIFLICQSATAPLFERTGLFDEISTVQVTLRYLRFPSFDLSRCLNHFSLKRFDLAIYLRTYPVYFKQFLKIPSRIQVHPRDPRLISRSVYQAPISLWGEKRVHQALQLLEIVSRLTGQNYDYLDVQFPPLQWSESDREALSLTFAGETPTLFFVVHPFARHETRRYPMEYWGKVLQTLRSKFNLSVVVVGGKEDPLLGSPSDLIQMQGKLTLAQTAYLISKSTAFLGNESGPAHIAGALRVPTITFFSGHSTPVEWAPLGKTLVLRADVPCAPCHRRTCPVYGLACLKELTPERVLPEVEKFLNKHLVPESKTIQVNATVGELELI